ncbi:MAG: hypothetical protein J1E84_02210 [Muribaculaceae bacterium]|nr:hypothetical protein [Muribaculaceae bacterium]
MKKFYSFEKQKIRAILWNSTRIALALLALLATPKSLMAFDDYVPFWDDNLAETRTDTYRYFIIAFDPDQSSFTRMDLLQNYSARRFNDELVIVLPYMTYRRDTRVGDGKGSGDKHSGFVIARTNKKYESIFTNYEYTIRDEVYLKEWAPVNPCTLITPADGTGTKEFDDYEIERYVYKFEESGYVCENLKLVDFDKAELYEKQATITRGKREYETYVFPNLTNYFKVPENVENGGFVYNVIIRIKFDSNDRYMETPQSVKVTYEKTPKPRIIGSVCRTSPSYDFDGRDGWESLYGWDKWIELEGDDYPYTYTFVAGAEYPAPDAPDDPNNPDDPDDPNNPNNPNNPDNHELEQNTGSTGAKYANQVYYCYYDFMYALPNPYKDSFEERSVYEDPNDCFFNHETSNYFKDWEFVNPYQIYWPIYEYSPEYKYGRPWYIKEIELELGQVKEMTGDNQPWCDKNSLRTNSGNRYRTDSQFERNYSIHLNKLEAGKVYQIKIDRPAIDDVITHNDTELPGTGAGNRYYAPDEMVRLNGYVSITKQEDPTLKAFQLIQMNGELEGDNQVYYTIDPNADFSSETIDYYRVVLDDDNNVVDYNKTTGSIDIYFSNDCIFTNKIVVMPEFDPMETWGNPNSNIQISGYTGTLTHCNTGKTYRFNATKAIVLAGESIDIQSFTMAVDGIWYKNVYTVNEVVCEEKAYNDGEDHYDPTYWEIVPNERIVETPESFLNYNYGKSEIMTVADDPSITPLAIIDVPLTIPTPTPGDVSYLLSVENPVTNESNEDNSVLVRFYDNDLRGENDYLQMVYDLPTDFKINAHDFHVVFPYTEPKWNDELKNRIYNNGDPVFKYEFTVDRKPTGRSTFDDGNPGFYNADMGSIYDLNINETDGDATRTLGIQISPRDTETYQPIMLSEQTPLFQYGDVSFLNLWRKDMTAQVKLDLTAPEVNYDQNNEVTKLYRDIRRTKDGKYQEILAVRGLNITNNPDYLKDKVLYYGQDNEDETALYLVEYTEPGTQEYDRMLMTMEQLMSYTFVVAVGEKKYNSVAEWEAQGPEININQQDAVSPITVRNVYLFPQKNDGLTMQDSSSSNEQQRLKANVMNVDENGTRPVYYAVSTPPAQPLLEFPGYEDNGPVLSVDNVVIPSISLARSGHGYVELLAEDIALYSADGKLVANRKGKHYLNPGIYIAYKDNLMQKFVVR